MKIDTSYIRDEPQKDYAKRNKSGTRGRLLYNSIDRKCPENVNLIETESRLVITGAGCWNGDWL